MCRPLPLTKFVRGRPYLEAMGKTERIMELEAALLRGTPVLNARQWARRLGTDVRTIQRDLRLLRNVKGLHIVYRASIGGYRIEGGPRWVPDRLTRVERRRALVQLVHQLMATPGRSAEELAKEMQCCPRSVYRYWLELEKLAFPVIDSNGYRLAAEAFLPPLQLAPDELLAVLLGTNLLESEPRTETALAARRAKEKITRAIQGGMTPGG